PPTAIYVHEYLTVEGQKISKSLGNVIDPVAVAERFGTEALRYWLLREMPRTEDADFTVERLITRYNSDLANDLGNLLNRTVSMLHRYCSGVVPAAHPTGHSELAFCSLADRLPGEVEAALDAFDFRSALTGIWELVTRANRYVEERAPWALARRVKEGDATAEQELGTTLYTLAESLRLLAFHLAPFLPAAADKIATQLGIALETSGSWHDTTRWGGLPPGTHVAPPQPIFPRIELEG
ncbi:MAG: class I tRNA ligase family protein, partial [Chloroflexota bacterium]|nr:class I tRNA ligase family protein [Chloroflexota bacterium]